MRRKTRKQLPKLILAGGALSVCCAVMAYLTLQSMGTLSADALGCYAGIDQPQSVVIIDASEPRWDAAQARALFTYFSQLYDGLAFNERLSVYTTEGDQLASVVAPRFSVCGQATSSAELAQVNAAEASAGYLARQKQRLFDEVLMPELNQLLSLTPDASRRQKYESPILEIIQAVTRAARLDAGDRLAVVSDFIQNSESARFCRVQGDMPRFAAFKERPVYQGRLMPYSLNGVRVDALMLMRGGYGQDELQFCTSEDELRGFWREYFTENGAERVDFIRVRSGFAG